MLILSCSNIKELNTAFLVNLLFLDVSYTSLTELSTIGLNKIRFLWLHKAKIQILNAVNIPLIEVLGVDCTELMYLDISRNTRLRRLNCANTRISELLVDGLVFLEEIYIYDTAIIHIDLTMLPKLSLVWGCNDNDRVVLTAEGVERRI